MVEHQVDLRLICQVLGQGTDAILLTMRNEGIVTTPKTEFHMFFLREFVRSMTNTTYILNERGIEYLQGFSNLKRIARTTFVTKADWAVFRKCLNIKPGTEFLLEEQEQPAPLVAGRQLFEQMNRQHVRSALRPDRPLHVRVMVDLNLAHMIGRACLLEEEAIAWTSEHGIDVELESSPKQNQIYIRAKSLVLYYKIADDPSAQLSEAEIFSLGKLLTMPENEEFYNLDRSILENSPLANEARVRATRSNATLARRIGRNRRTNRNQDRQENEETENSNETTTAVNANEGTSVPGLTSPVSNRTRARTELRERTNQRHNTNTLARQGRQRTGRVGRASARIPVVPEAQNEGGAVDDTPESNESEPEMVIEEETGPNLAPVPQQPPPLVYEGLGLDPVSQEILDLADIRFLPCGGLISSTSLAVLLARGDACPLCRCNLVDPEPITPEQEEQLKQKLLAELGRVGVIQINNANNVLREPTPQELRGLAQMHDLDLLEYIDVLADSFPTASWAPAREEAPASRS